MILNDLNRRYACKLFDTTKKISTDDIITIKEALRLTSSSFGLQPWKFIIVSDDAIKQQLFAATTQNQIATCSHLVVLCGTNDIDDAHVDAFVASMVAHGGDAEKLAGYGQVMKNVMQSNRDAGAMREYIDDQVYIALGNLMHTASRLRIDNSPMGGFDKKAFDAILGLEEEGCHSVVLCALGYRAVDDATQRREKVRFGIDRLFLEK